MAGDQYPAPNMREFASITIFAVDFILFNNSFVILIFPSLHQLPFLLSKMTMIWSYLYGQLLQNIFKVLKLNKVTFNRN